MGGLTWAWYSGESSFHNNNKICFCCCCCVCVSGRALEGWRTVELLVWMSWVKIPILRPLLQSALKHSTHTHTHAHTSSPKTQREVLHTFHPGISPNYIPSTLESVFQVQTRFEYFFSSWITQIFKIFGGGGGVGGKSFIYLFQTGVPCMWTVQ